MTNEDIINYVYSTPENSNPNVLRDMLKEIATNSSDFGFVTLTIQNTDPNTELNFSGFVINDDYISRLSISIIDTETFELISYQGKAYFYLEADSISSLGGATNVGDQLYFITDSTIITGTGSHQIPD